MVSKEIDKKLLSAIKVKKGSFRKGSFLVSDLKSVSLVFAATDEAKINAKICSLAKKKMIFASSASNAGQGDFSVPALAKSGPIQIAISTGGASPSMAKAIARQLQDALKRSGLGAAAAKMLKTRDWIRRMKMKDAK